MSSKHFMTLIIVQVSHSNEALYYKLVSLIIKYGGPGLCMILISANS